MQDGKHRLVLESNSYDSMNSILAFIDMQAMRHNGGKPIDTSDYEIFNRGGMLRVIVGI